MNISKWEVLKAFCSVGSQINGIPFRVKAVNGKKVDTDGSVYQTCHFMSHYQFLKSKNTPQFQAKKGGEQKDGPGKKGSEYDQKAAVLNKYRSQGLQLRKDERAGGRFGSDEEENSNFDKRKVYANKGVKVDQFGKFLEFKETHRRNLHAASNQTAGVGRPITMLTHQVPN